MMRRPPAPRAACFFSCLVIWHVQPAIRAFRGQVRGLVLYYLEARVRMLCRFEFLTVAARTVPEHGPGQVDR
ncbi:hypothetical protein F5883DRAFT_558832 [Diaporthe sp. PMI_573]|jgi:hypothetical protein|nr:hypothetical protein F5883DRAFT_558832 [Diaporthaceae sp. PMI_573]